MTTTILLATDLGPELSNLLQHTLRLASNFEARIIIIHAVEPLGAMAGAVVQSYLPGQLNKGLEEDLDTINRQIKCRVIDALEEEFMQGEKELSRLSDVQVLSGRPADIILEYAARCEADLIVMGKHGQYSSFATIMGSVANRVLQLASVPVYLVPPNQQAPFQAKAC
jgi:nucleotide-binding universal stress UspA family protein